MRDVAGSDRRAHLGGEARRRDLVEVELQDPAARALLAHPRVHAREVARKRDEDDAIGDLAVAVDPVAVDAVVDGEHDLGSELGERRERRGDAARRRVDRAADRQLGTRAHVALRTITA